MPVPSPSLRLSFSASALSCAVELPVQVSVMMPPTSDASAGLASDGPSAACCAGQIVLLLLKLASKSFFSCV